MSETVAVFNGEKMTRREVEIARESYATALRSQCCTPPAEAYRRAIAVYPLPTIRRPRVVADDGGIQWRVEGLFLQWHGASGEWRRTQDYNCMSIYADRVKLWADLFANPTETVEDES